jgi:hypothetical protein
MNFFSKESQNNSQKQAKTSQYHFSSKFILDSQTPKRREYHSFSSSPDVEKEYQELITKPKQKTEVDITSESLKYEYAKKLKALDNGLKHIFIISLLCLFHCFTEFKILKISELNVAILVINCISITLILMLFFNIKTKILVDTYGYVFFYLSSITESVIMIILFTLKIVNFLVVYNRLNGGEVCRVRNRGACSGYFGYLLILVLNVLIFVGIFTSMKFIFSLFYDAFNILTKRRKTMFQRQIEINENNPKNGTIEFVDENDSINNSLYKLNSTDYLKSE